MPFDTNNDGLMEPLECLARDGTNLMFWTTDPSISQTTLTSNQQFVMLAIRSWDRASHAPNRGN